FHAVRSIQRRCRPNRLRNHLELTKNRGATAGKCGTISAKVDQVFLDPRQLRISGKNRGFEVVGPDITRTLRNRLGTETSNGMGFLRERQPGIGLGRGDHHTWIDQNYPVIRCVIELVDIVASPKTGSAAPEGEEGDVGTQVAQRLRHLV